MIESVDHKAQAMIAALPHCDMGRSSDIAWSGDIAMGLGQDNASGQAER